MNPLSAPDPTLEHPVPGQPRVIFLRPHVGDHPSLDIGEFTYYDDIALTGDFIRNNVLYRFGEARLVIGRYCAIASGARFILAAGNHPMIGVTTYPFSMFGGAWQEQCGDVVASVPGKGDTVVGNDVWIGLSALVLPGVHIGDGAIIGAGAVVASDIPPYSVAVGNPARVVKKRFTDEEIATLLRVAWWHWPVEKVTAHARTILAGDVASVAALAELAGYAPAGSSPSTDGA